MSVSTESGLPKRLQLWKMTRPSPFETIPVVRSAGSPSEWMHAAGWSWSFTLGGATIFVLFLPAPQVS